MAFFYTGDGTDVPLVAPGTVNRCLIANLAKVRAGTPMRFGADSIGCAGGKRYCGFGGTLRANFSHFLSYGIPGELEGERYKKTPELVDEVMKQTPKFRAPARYLVFKRWDTLGPSDEPAVVLFTAAPEVLSGLFTLANYDTVDQACVIPPFGAGCAQAVQHPYLEQLSGNPHCVVGLFDPSARPYVPADTLTFAVPMKKFAAMVEQMDESFLITGTWKKNLARIKKSG